MFILSLLLLTLLNSITVLSLPTKALKHSLLVDLPFHPLNSETLLFSQETDSLLLRQKKNIEHDWFMANLDTSLGQFKTNNNLQLSIDQDSGLLSLNKLNTNDEVLESSVFGIQNGFLTNENSNQFTICCLDLESDSFQLYSSSKFNEQTECSCSIKGVKLKVLDQLGISPDDFEVEFIYGAGKKLFHI